MKKLKEQVEIRGEVTSIHELRAFNITTGLQETVETRVSMNSLKSMINPGAMHPDETFERLF